MFNHINLGDENIYKIIDLLNVSIYWKDIKGNYLGCNNYMLNMFHLKSRAEIAGKNDYSILVKNEADKIIEIDQSVIQGCSYYGEEVSTLANGEIKTYFTTKTPILDGNSKIIGLLGISMDITNVKNKMEKEKQEAILNEEQKIRQIIDVVDASIYWKDENGYMRGCNQYVLDMFGAKKREEIIGKNEYDLVPEEEALNINKIDKLVLKDGSYRGEEVFTVRDSKQITMQTVKNQLLDNQGNVIGIVGTSLDITAQKEAERLALEVQAQTAALKEQEKFRAIVDQVVHDIRSPLSSMQMILPLCTKLPENLRVSLNKAATRILDIANNLLSKFKPKEKEIAEPDTTDKTLLVPTLISAELLEIITEKKYEYTKLPIDFNTNISSTGYFAFLNMDILGFKRMISNLINNAVDVFKGGIGEISIYLDVIDDYVQIIIQDNGTGMPEDVKEKILKNVIVTSGKTEGHGIGFTQVWDTLAKNNGKLNIESKAGVGTKIILTFPAIEAPDWIANKIELYNDDLIIVLDDDDSIHGAWEARFKQSAPNIRRKHFKQGNEAVEFINNLDVIEKNRVFLLTDYELLRQGLHGLDVVQKTEINRSILVTSHHNNQTVRDLAKLTNTKILPKPLASEIFINILKDKPQPKLYSKNNLKKVDLIFIDDDKEFADIFMRVVAKENKIADQYYTARDFLNNIHNYPKNTKILLDNKLSAENITGIDLARQLHKFGFSNLYLFSGRDFSQDSSVPSYLTTILKTDYETVKQLLNE